MKTPIKIALSWFTRKFQEITGELPKAIQEELNKEVSPQKAVNDTFKKQGIFGKLRQRMTEVIEKAAEIGFGKKPPKMPELFEAWDASKMNLSEKLHGADVEMRKSIINAIKEQLKLGNRAQKSALALYDGYNSGKRVIRTQELPIYLKNIVNFTRRGNLSDKDKEQLQRLIRNARKQVEKLGENGAPNKALKAAYNELLQAVEDGKEKVLERGIKTAVEEKSRYVAERIARTEAARAWADAFIARYENDKDVVAYKWQLGSRHPHFDICDMYANANLYNLGKGIFPKDKCPTLPVHPHCLCHLTPIFKNEVDITKQKDCLKEGGAEWLKSLTESERVKLLGINGALQFKNGGDFLLSLRGYSSEVMGTRLKNVVTDVANSGKIVFGGIMENEKNSGALNPNSERASEHAERYYKAVRAMKTDCKRIAINTGFSEKDVQKIKNYIFIEEHDLGEYGKRRFDASYYMAESWRRLIDGKDIQPHDLILLKHELLEEELMQEGISQEQAHELASKQYDYAKEARKYHGNIDKHNKGKG